MLALLDWVWLDLLMAEEIPERVREALDATWFADSDDKGDGMRWALRAVWCGNYGMIRLVGKCGSMSEISLGFEQPEELYQCVLQ